jgi:hypothetical protein
VQIYNFDLANLHPTSIFLQLTSENLQLTRVILQLASANLQLMGAN